MLISWIPLLGPILQGLFNTASTIYSKYKDTELGKLQTNRASDIEEAKLTQQTIQIAQDDVALRIMRDAMVLPVAVWSMLIGWDTIIGDPKQQVISHDWMWHVAGYPDTVAYLPYVVVVFLFGNIGLNMWKRK